MLAESGPRAYQNLLPAKRAELPTTCRLAPTSLRNGSCRTSAEPSVRIATGEPSLAQSPQSDVADLHQPLHTRGRILPATLPAPPPPLPAEQLVRNFSVRHLYDLSSKWSNWCAKYDQKFLSVFSLRRRRPAQAWVHRFIQCPSSNAVSRADCPPPCRWRSTCGALPHT